MSSILNALGLSQGEQQTLTSNTVVPGRSSAETANNKRKKADVSILSVSSFEQPKHSNLLTSSPLLSDDTTPLTSDQVMVKALESSLEGVYDRPDLLLSKLGSLEETVVDLKQQGENYQQQFTDLVVQVRQGEERVESLEQRVAALETHTEGVGWPHPLVDVNMKLLGDSN